MWERFGASDDNNTTTLRIMHSTRTHRFLLVQNENDDTVGQQHYDRKNRQQETVDDLHIRLIFLQQHEFLFYCRVKVDKNKLGTVPDRQIESG